MVALPVYLIYNTGIRMEGAGMMKRLLKYIRVSIGDPIGIRL